VTSRPARRPALRPLRLLLTLAVLAVGLLAAPPTRADAQATGCPAAGANFADLGPFEVTMQAEAAHTYFSPTELGSQGCTVHPVILWGNGTWTTPEVYAPLLRHLASHGFIVVAANTSNAGSGVEIKAGLDNLTAFNGQQGHRFFQKVDLTKVGVTGHSQGGGGAIEAAKDPRIKVLAPLAAFLGNQTGLQSDDIAIFFAGTLDTWIPPAGVKARFSGVTIPAAYAEAAEANHFHPAGDGNMFKAPLTAWFRWHLLGDTTARGMFVGESCGLCNDPVWADYEANAALQTLGAGDPGPGPGPGPGPNPQPGTCITATNAEHGQAGRVTVFLFFAYTKNSSHFVGFTWTSTSQRLKADGTWEHVVSGC
jgi:hypothetical protein